MPALPRRPHMERKQGHPQGVLVAFAGNAHVGQLILQDGRQLACAARAGPAAAAATAGTAAPSAGGWASAQAQKHLGVCMRADASASLKNGWVIMQCRATPPTWLPPAAAHQKPAGSAQDSKAAN